MAAAVALSMVFLLLLLLLRAAAALECVPFEGAPDFCAPFLAFNRDIGDPRYMVALAEGETLAERAEQAQGAFPSALRVAPSACRKSALQLLCLSLFPACTDLPDNVGHTPRAVCTAACEAVAAACSGLVDATSLPDCSALSSTDTVVATNSTMVSVPCVGSGALPSKVKTSCPNAFAYDHDLDQCVPSCPLSSTNVNHAERQILYWLRLSVSYVAIACLLLHTLTYICLAEHRMFPTNLITVYSVFLLLTTGGWCLVDSVDVDDFSCASETESRNEGALCTAQSLISLLGIIGSFFTLLTLALWYVTIVADPGGLYDIVRSRRTAAITYITLPLVILGCWLPFVVNSWVGWVLATSGVCLMGHNEHPDRALLAFCIPYTVVIALVAVSLLVIVCMLIRHHASMYGLKEGMSRSFRDYWRLLAFLLVSELLHMYSLALTWVSYDLSIGTVERATEYYKCNVQGGSDCTFETSPPFGAMVIQWVIYPSHGIMLFLIFHTSRYMRGWWRILLYERRIVTSAHDIMHPSSQMT